MELHQDPKYNYVVILFIEANFPFSMLLLSLLMTTEMPRLLNIFLSGSIHYEP
jgi:hypothetical protein